jgi:predicted O-linked N-acetylglucosamine transferase (SPINDLY family)
LTNINTHQAKRSQGKLKIGYISCNLRRHSIGWLSRWLLHYHDREKLEVYLYLINQNEDDITDKWFANKDNFVHRLDENIPAIVQQIQEDQLDILVDLESMTSPTICWVMALKPAPIQITWLGLDATGLPSIDYFLVDPHVVPADAQQYYQEKLWRLTPSYLAVDGFEIGLANLTRKDLNIPDDAVIYLTSQSGYKRHLEMIKMQLTILKKVPNSYLLVKGFANKDIIKELFEKLAQEQNVPLENLRFLTFDTNEETHRANLQLADVILDTYPYNGATTTLEVLWLGIPIVTLVGEQFAARNSYTFMLNAGITEGIAYNAQEYIDWGIKLGTSEDLRSKIHWKLWNSRQNAPLWNAQQFTKTVEDAYFAIARP